MILQNKTAAAQTTSKLTRAEKIHNEPAVDNTKLVKKLEIHVQKHDRNVLFDKLQIFQRTHVESD